MTTESNEQGSAAQAPLVPPRRVRQALARAARAAAGVHLHSRRNPQRLPVTNGQSD